jgi:hypothetical protein
MIKKVYIVGDVIVDFTEEEYYETFTNEEIKLLEKGETIQWVDEIGYDHAVRLIKPFAALDLEKLKKI